MKKYLKKYALVFPLLGIVLLFHNCQSSTPKEVKLHEESNTTTDIRSSKRINAAVIVQKVTFPNMPFAELIRLMNLTKDSSPAALWKTISALPPLEQMKKDSFDIENPLQRMELMLVPLRKMEIKFDQQQAKSDAEGLTYRLQNYVNYGKSSGEGFLANRENEGINLALNFPEGKHKEFAKVQIRINPKEYMIDKTGKTKVIAGITCQQAIYNKIDANDNILPKFVVWKSPRIPKGINLLHPYVFDEKEGILEIDAYLNADENSLLRFTTTAVVEKKFEPKDFEIREAHAKLDGAKDQNSIEKNVLDVVFH
ncbi:hypothetical protein ACLCDV_20855 [Sphingobacterium sp. Lzh-3]|uniref:hypothetical protein n=1 Tax=unclassified Sphingobacterium TaxID=2609468 RepID=UPI0029531C44|nr:hypothetical protein [Sphingobacterium sp. UGAL515B_05]WON92164.1 hypothetical protein OK025_13010 [Sphingobacterium sp. UGAL515B_05]